MGVLITTNYEYPIEGSQGQSDSVEEKCYGRAAGRGTMVVSDIGNYVCRIINDRAEQFTGGSLIPGEG